MGNHTHFYFDLQAFAEDDGDTPAPIPQIPDIRVDADGQLIQTQTTPIEPEGDPPAPEAEFDVIVYNKEEVKIPVAERQTYLQKGYNYDKIHQRATEQEQQLKAINEWVAKTYGDKGINTWDEWQKALGEQQRRQQLEEMGLDEQSYEQIVDSDPKLQQLKQQAEAYERQMREQAVQQQLQTELKQANDLFGLDLRNLEDITHLDNAEQIVTLCKSGLSLADAYLVANREAVLGRQKRAARQQALNQLNSKSHLKEHGASGAGNPADEVEIPAEVLRMYKDLNPGRSMKEYREHWLRSQRE